MTTNRRILTLPKKNDDDVADTQVPVGIFDVLLPARNFRVKYKVAEVGEVSLTTEFLLRLLYSADGVPEPLAALFFGFDNNELAYVIKDAESRDYVFRQDGRIWLTDAGRSLFRDGGKPQIYDVHSKKDVIGFDLLSLAPCDRENLSRFERSLEELPIRDIDLAANASRYIGDSFRRFFSEITSRKDKNLTETVRRSLYSIDEVDAGAKFSGMVTFVAMSSLRRPHEPEPVLQSWKNGRELSDREKIVHGVAEYLEKIRTTKDYEDDNAYDVLTSIAPNYMSEYRVKNGFSALRYFKEMSNRSGQIQKNRSTIGLIGALYQPDNSERIIKAIGYSADPPPSVEDCFIWVKPIKHAYWGSARSFFSLYESLKSYGRSTIYRDESELRLPILVDVERPAWHIRNGLTATYVRPNNGAIPDSLEILLIPNRIVAVMVHAPIGEVRGFPIPIGFLSFDREVVKRAHEYLIHNLPRNIRQLESGNSFALAENLAWEYSEEALSLDAGSEERD